MTSRFSNQTRNGPVPYDPSAAIRAQLEAERSKALAGYRAAVMDGTFPDANTSVSMVGKQLAELKELLEKCRPLHD